MKVVTTEMNKEKILSIAEYLGCNGEELWSEISRLVAINGRDAVTKQKFIEYLQQDSDERFFQALTNFTGYGYIGAASRPDGTNFKDLWHVEADKSFVWGEPDEQ